MSLKPLQVKGSFRCPPDKSITHRSFMFAGMAKGVSEVHNPLLGQDCRSTLKVIEQLGAKVTLDEKAALVKIDSQGYSAWQSPLEPLDFGNSGTTARLMLGPLSGHTSLFCVAFGDQSLSQRPMKRVVQPLREAGAKICGRDDGNLLPLAIQGGELGDINHTATKASAQVKSCLLLAGLGRNGKTIVTLPAGSRDHTERMLTKLGAQLLVSQKDNMETVELTGPFQPEPAVYRVPGDPSSAAFFSVLAAIADSGSIEISNVLDNQTRCGFLQVLQRAGVPFQTKALDESSAIISEPCFDLVVEGGARLTAFTTEPEELPAMIDEIPVLAVLAMFCDGISRFKGLGELRVKESDRLAKTAELVNLAGGKADIDGDDLVVMGRSESLTGFQFDPAHDHRMAMSAAILASRIEDKVEIEDSEVVSVSFPTFFDLLAKLS